MLADGLRGRSRCRSSPCSATTTGTATGPTSSSRRSTDAGVRVLDRGWAIAEVDGVDGRDRRREGLRRRLPRTRSCPTSASRSCARSTRRRAPRSTRSTRGARGDRRLRAPRSCCCTTRRRRRRSRASRAAIWTFLGTDRLAGADRRAPPGPRPPRPRPRRHASRARSATCPVYNVAVPVLGRDFFVFELDGTAVRPA